MLDVVGLNVELVNATFDAFQLDKQVSLPTKPKQNLKNADFYLQRTYSILRNRYLSRANAFYL
jgi:hypothetical protein